MALTRLSVGREIQIVFDDRKSVETITEAKVMLMRDGKDLEAELEARQKKPDDHTFELSRTPLGDLQIVATYMRRTRA